MESVVAGETLRERRDHFQVALASVADAVIAVDSAGRVTYLNPAAELVTAWSADDAVGLPLSRCFKIVHDDSGAALDSVFEAVRRSSDKIEHASHTALVNRRGILVPIECSASPIRDGGNAFAGVVIVFRDVGGRRAAERAHEQLEGPYALHLWAGPLGVATAALLRGAREHHVPCLELRAR